MTRLFLFLAIAVAALSAPAATLSAGSNSLQNEHDINLLCLSWGSGYSGGMDCIPDSGSYQPGRAHIETMQGNTHNWTIVRAQIPGAKTVLCARLYNRSHGKSGYYGNSGLSCFPETQPAALQQGSFQIKGTQIPTNGGEWWLNNLSIDGQNDHTCLSWDTSGAGVYCFPHSQGVYNGGAASVHGWMTRSDNWWVNKLEIPGIVNQICITWDESNAGGVSCFPQEGDYEGSPQLTLAQRINDRWGVNVLQIPGQRQRVCLVWDGLGGAGGGMSCLAHGGYPEPANATVRSFHLGQGYELDRVHIPVG